MSFVYDMHIGKNTSACKRIFLIWGGRGGGGGAGDTSLKNISVSYMFNRGNYIFNPNFQKGTSSTKKKKKKKKIWDNSRTRPAIV